MPIWPVSYVDGSYQVADADGALYPITMQGTPLPAFNAGWGPRGLQTGLPPFHVLELEHTDGATAYWVLDSGLEYQGNSANSLLPSQLELYLEHVEPLVRNLYDDAVRASHAAVPAAAHAFDGFRPENVLDLLKAVIPTVPGRPDIVSRAMLAGIGIGYSRSGITLPTSWVEQLLRVAVDPAGPSGGSLAVPSPGGGGTVVSQERLTLPGHAAYRFLERSTGVVFYLLVGKSGADRHLYVPSASVIFTEGGLEAGHDPLALLLCYYATHINRVVMLPEAEGLEPGLVHVVPPPQVGLDEPPVAPPAAPPITEPVLAEASAGYEAPPRPPAEPLQPAMTAEPVATMRAMPEPPPARMAPAPSRVPLKQNWWQRLLGLGND